jgi:uncharacterized protein involved in response to NO
MVIPRYRSTDTPTLFSAGFRPFFLAAGLWACMSMLVWVLMLRGAVELPTAFDPVTWHFHELLFGFVAAAIGGFLLTAIPNWTGRLPLQGWPLATLALLWLAGRVAVSVSALTGIAVAAAIDLAFLATLLAVVLREIVAGRNWRNLPVTIALALLVVANALIHAGMADDFAWTEVGKRLAIAVVVMLISLIGGRIVPSFTANWLRRRQSPALPVAFNGFDKGTLGLSAVALASWIVFDLTVATGLLLIAAALAHTVRLVRWRGDATTAEPLLWILHVAYAWIPIGLALLGIAAWMPSLATTALHALTAGAMGTMILAVMTRATLGHSGRALSAGKGTLAVYLFVLIATLARIIAPFLDAGYSPALDLAGTAWIAAFALFVALYLPLYVRR